MADWKSALAALRSNRREMECAICHRKFTNNVRCEHGHSLFFFCKHIVQLILSERARLMPYLRHLELSAGINYRFFLKTFEEHVSEFIKTLAISIAEFTTSLVADSRLGHFTMIEI